MKPFVVGVVATYRRAPELARMLRSLEGVSVPMALLVVDNADDPDTALAVCKQPAGVEVVRLVPGSNLGCGGGLAYGERAAMARYGDRLTHILPMDDDIEFAAGTLEQLLDAMKRNGADLACPLIVWPDGRLGWTPGLVERRPFRAALKAQSPSNYLARFGDRSIRFTWATGVCLLATRRALEKCGFHRDDFLIRGEDLEWTLRITARYTGIFVPGTMVRHLPRTAAESPEAAAAEHRKHGAMLQNIAYIAVHLSHGHRLLKHLPGNLWKFVRTWGLPALLEGLRLYWIGAVSALPAGASTKQSGVDS